MLYGKASARVFGLSSLYHPSRRWVREGDPETWHTLGHAYYSVGMLILLLKGKKYPKQKNLTLLFFSRSSNQCSIWPLYCSLLGANLSASMFLKLFASCWAFVLLKREKQFCLEPLPCCYFVWHWWVKLPTAGWPLRGSHIFWALTCLHVPIPHTGSGRVHLCVKMVGPRNDLATISVALYIICVENESCSVERALLANGILHPTYLLLPYFKTTRLCQMHS